MFDLEFDRPVEIFGQTIRNLSDATYHVRQYAISTNDTEARMLVRDARDAETAYDAKLAAARMQKWIQVKRLDRSNESAHYSDRAKGSRDERARIKIRHFAH